MSEPIILIFACFCVFADISNGYGEGENSNRPRAQPFATTTDHGQKQTAINTAAEEKHCSEGSTPRVCLRACVRAWERVSVQRVRALLVETPHASRCSCWWSLSLTQQKPENQQQQQRSKVWTVISVCVSSVESVCVTVKENIEEKRERVSTKRVLVLVVSTTTITT